MLQQNDVLEELLGQARAGDKDALAELCKKNQGYAFTVARNVLGNAANDCESIVSQGVLKVFEKIDSCQADNARMFRGWYGAIVRNLALVRAAKKQDLLGSISDKLQAAGESPSKLLERSERRDRMLAALQRLTPQDQLAVNLWFFAEVGYDELAEQLNTTPQTARKRVSRAVAALRALLEDSHD